MKRSRVTLAIMEAAAIDALLASPLIKDSTGTSRSGNFIASDKTASACTGKLRIASYIACRVASYMFSVSMMPAS